MTSISSLPTVSLVIPTYNRAGLIGATLASAVAQVPPFSEIIVIDDGSNDETAAVITQINHSIIYQRIENGGVQRARNLGAELATSEWLVFCDSDDLLDSQYTVKVFSYLAKVPPIDAAYVNFCNFSDTGQRPNKLSLCPFDYLEGANTINEVAFNIPELLIRNFQFQPLFPSGMVVRRSFYLSLNGFDQTLRGVGAEDWDFTLRAIAHGRIAVFKQPLAYVRRHASNDSLDSLRMLKGEIKILHEFRRRFPMQGGELKAWNETVNQRSAAIANASYHLQMFNDVIQYTSWGAMRKGGVKLLVKYLIACSPSLIRMKAWGLFQRLGDR